MFYNSFLAVDCVVSDHVGPRRYSAKASPTAEGSWQRCLALAAQSACMLHWSLLNSSSLMISRTCPSD